MAGVVVCVDCACFAPDMHAHHPPAPLCVLARPTTTPTTRHPSEELAACLAAVELDYLLARGAGWEQVQPWAETLRCVQRAAWYQLCLGARVACAVPYAVQHTRAATVDAQCCCVHTSAPAPSTKPAPLPNPAAAAAGVVVGCLSQRRREAAAGDGAPAVPQARVCHPG